MRIGFGGVSGSQYHHWLVAYLPSIEIVDGESSRCTMTACMRQYSRAFELKLVTRLELTS